MRLTMPQRLICKVWLFPGLKKIWFRLLNPWRLFFCFLIYATCHSWFVLAWGGLIYTISAALEIGPFPQQEVKNSGMLAWKVTERSQKITEQIHCSIIQIKITWFPYKVFLNLIYVMLVFCFVLGGFFCFGVCCFVGFFFWGGAWLVFLVVGLVFFLSCYLLYH